MAIKLTGTADDLEVGSKHKGARIAQYPMEIGARGSYQWGSSSGIIPAALAANSELVQFRWSHATHIALLRSVRISAAVTTTFFAAGVPLEIEMRRAATWSAQGTGGTGFTFGAQDNKKRTDFAQSAMTAGDLRIATTAALGTGTKTLDTNAVANMVAGGPITASLNGTIYPLTTLWERNTGDEWPFVFEQNEGFVLRSVAVPATGTWRLSCIIEWIEVDPSVLTNWA